MNKNGLINEGNITKIVEVMQKAKRGEACKIAFLGGSITQGSRATSNELCYASLVFKWWVDKFPMSEMELINAGIGGTTSQFGVARVGAHVLDKRPDFLLTEFAVNDEDNEFFKETYEGLVRKVLKAKNAPALLLMNNAWFDSGMSAEKIHLDIAKHYDVPMVSMKSTIFKAIKDGELIKEDLSEDMLHPNDKGHRLVADVIIDFLERVYQNIDSIVAKENTMPMPLTNNSYENSVRIKNYNMDDSDYEVISDGFSYDMHEKKEFLDIYSGGFTASSKGASISFKAKCIGIAIQYKKTINLPAPIAKAVIDGDEENAVILDANFDETWGDCLYIETAARNLPLDYHTVKITLTDTHDDDKVPFYLVSVIINL